MRMPWRPKVIRWSPHDGGLYPVDNTKIFGVPQSLILADIGVALLQVKNARGLTLADMGVVLGRIDDMASKYIAGEAEMGVVAWLRANEAWPELPELINEAARCRSRPIDLPTRKNVA